MVKIVHGDNKDNFYYQNLLFQKGTFSTGKFLFFLVFERHTGFRFMGFLKTRISNKNLLSNTTYEPTSHHGKSSPPSLVRPTSTLSKTLNLSPS